MCLLPTRLSAECSSAAGAPVSNSWLTVMPMPAPRREPGCQGADTGEEEEGGGDPESETGGPKWNDREQQCD